MVIVLRKITHRKLYRRLQGIYTRRPRDIFGVLKVKKMMGKHHWRLDEGVEVFGVCLGRSGKNTMVGFVQMMRGKLMEKNIDIWAD